MSLAKGLYSLFKPSLCFNQQRFSKTKWMYDFSAIALRAIYEYVL